MDFFSLDVEKKAKYEVGFANAEYECWRRAGRSKNISVEEDTVDMLGNKIHLPEIEALVISIKRFDGHFTLRLVPGRLRLSYRVTLAHQHYD